MKNYDSMNSAFLILVEWQETMGVCVIACPMMVIVVILVGLRSHKIFGLNFASNFWKDRQTI